MNIFVTSNCPVECAKTLDNKRVVKMCLETAQMLCTTIKLKGFATPYKMTHANHPCTKWVRSRQSNYNWTVRHFEALLAEYERRYKKKHACEGLKLLFGLFVTEDSTVEEFVNCTPYPELPVFDAYKQLLSDKWKTDKRKPVWDVKSV